jgi:hypothetical protein
MAVGMRRGLGLVGFGLLLAFVGLVWVANLFGVADEHARRIVTNPWNRRMARWSGRELDMSDPMNNPGMRLGRYLFGIGFMVAGALIVSGGIVYLLIGPEE